MKLFWVAFMFGFISFTIGLILLYKYVDEWWQLETIEADSSYKVFNRNGVLHFIFPSVFVQPIIQNGPLDVRDSDVADASSLMP